MPDLVPPTTRVHASFLEAVDELVAEGRAEPDSILRRWIDLYGAGWHTEDGFATFVDYLRADALPESPRPEGHVPQRTWWLVDESDYLGRISLRHPLNDKLRWHGGHVGYEVRPSRRREGHATTMLRGVLPHARALGLSAGVGTVDPHNDGTGGAGERCGGVRMADEGTFWRYEVPTG